MTTFYQTKENADLNRKWLIVDADGKTLGRLASEVASLLKGKHKPTFSTHTDGGDFVVVINAAKVKLTGQKLDKKLYRHHTGFPGGVKETTAGQLMQKDPTRLIECAVWGMIAKGPLGRKVYSKLKVYKDAEHPHKAQAPEVWEMRG